MQIAMAAMSNRDFPATVERVRAALTAQGFGVLSEIDVQAKMAEKLQRKMNGYLILGACMPALAWDAIHANPQVGVMLPCNVCIRETGEGVEILAMEPESAMNFFDDPVISKVALDVSARLHRVLKAATA